MVYAFQARCIFATANARNQVLNRINSVSAGRPKWGVEVIESISTDDGAPALSVETRFISNQDQQMLVADLEGYLTGPRLPQPGSWYSFHDCTHDPAQPDTPCVATRRDW